MASRRSSCWDRTEPAGSKQAARASRAGIRHCAPFPALRGSHSGRRPDSRESVRLATAARSGSAGPSRTPGSTTGTHPHTEISPGGTTQRDWCTETRRRGGLGCQRVGRLGPPRPAVRPARPKGNRTCKRGRQRQSPPSDWQAIPRQSHATAKLRFVPRGLSGGRRISPRIGSVDSNRIYSPFPARCSPRPTLNPDMGPSHPSRSWQHAGATMPFRPHDEAV